MMINFQVVMPRGLVSGPCVCVSAAGNTMSAQVSVTRSGPVVVIHLTDGKDGKPNGNGDVTVGRGHQVPTPPWLRDVILNWVNGRPHSRCATIAHVNARLLGDFCEGKGPDAVFSGFLLRVCEQAGVLDMAESYLEGLEQAAQGNRTD